MAKQYEGAVRNLEGADTPPPGYHQKSSNQVSAQVYELRELSVYIPLDRKCIDFQIHLGHNVWIDKKVYDDVHSASKTTQLFAKNMAVAVFGYRVLESSSVSGTQSNKFKDRLAKPKLDSNKILAIRGEYVFNF